MRSHTAQVSATIASTGSNIAFEYIAPPARRGYAACDWLDGTTAPEAPS
ncbi:hypothetical protein [Lysobacter sp. 1R34A]